MLQNRLYRGEITHKGKAYPGQHQAIIDAELRQSVQQKLAVNRQGRTLGAGAQDQACSAGCSSTRMAIA